MGDVVRLSMITRLDVPVESVIEGAAAASLSDVVVCGFHEDGSLYFASSYASMPNTLWLLERCKDHLMKLGADSAD